MRSTTLLLASVAVLASDCSAARISGYVDASSSTQLQRVLAQTYSYIVIGGGNTGLTVASRLSEDSRKTVLVIEAGKSARENPGVITPGLSGSTFLSEVDWAFFTQPQEHANNRSIYWPRGKMLGGSSGLNFLALTRPSAPDLAAIAALTGAWDWTWATFSQWFKKSESYTSPGPNNLNATRTDTPWVHGNAKVGVSSSYPPFLSPQFGFVQEAMEELGVFRDQDWADGYGEGWGWSASSIDPVTRQRETSDTAYIAPVIAKRTNLVVLTSAQAVKINWSADKVRGNVVATGVDFVALSKPKKVLSACASSEVILSAGSIATPQLLELSGVGDPSILKPLGISTVVNLPGVGENLQDHPGVAYVIKLADGLDSLDGLAGQRLNAALAAFAKGDGILTQELSFLTYLRAHSFQSPTDQVKGAVLALTSNSALPKEQQLATLGAMAAGTPIMEIVPINVYFGENAAGEANTTYLSIAACLQQSLSRGSIHIGSADPLAAPLIDAAYLQHPFDLHQLSRAAKFLRRLTHETSFAKYVVAEAEPGPKVQTDADWEEWIRAGVRTEYHPIGTASMGARKAGYVVSPKFIVHGTANVRVADLSIMPIHVSAHVQTMAYAIGEKAASMILADSA